MENGQPLVKGNAAHEFSVTQFMRQEVMTNNTYYLHKVIYADNRVAVAF